MSGKAPGQSGQAARPGREGGVRAWTRKNAVNLLLVLAALIGAGLIAYPTFSDWWNSFHQSRAVASYAGVVADLTEEQYGEILSKAEAYNRKLEKSGTVWNPDEKMLEEYRGVLNVSGTGVMGYIDIPKIHITLPVYHGVDDDVLQVAIGHLPGTSLPVGGKGSHCVVSGHRGLPSARLFTDLDKLVEGDSWTMTILNRTLTYEVDQIRVVEPTDLAELQIVPGKDYCTLVTCTPYGINTHRLLVRGHRIANAQGEANVIADALQIEPVYIAPFVSVPILVVLLVLLILNDRARKKESRARSAFRAEKERMEQEIRKGRRRISRDGSGNEK